MKLYLKKLEQNLIKSKIRITGSKSETNRLLLLQSLFENLSLKNLSNSDDAIVMQKGLQATHGEVDIHHAGTAMRFLTSYFASGEGKEVVLTGSGRMKERPIKVLVDALRGLDADISYVENEGYPPLKIKGKKLTKTAISLPADVSSQYISSLLLIAPHLTNGLVLDLVGNITSVPYIKMTLGLLNEIGVQTEFEGNQLRVYPKAQVDDKTMVVESDWSAASYFYSITALAEVGSEIQLSSYKKDSLQGDSVLSEIYKNFGVKTHFEENTIILKKTESATLETLSLKLHDAPDIAQTIAVTCFGLGMGCDLTGLHTLPIKETDRLAAMKVELEKVGATVTITDESLHVDRGHTIVANQEIDTYNDHRMAMAFAPLALKSALYINDAGVVSKSYPDFWKDMKRIGLEISSV